MGDAVSFSSTKSEAIAGPLINIKTDEPEPDDPNIQYISCKNRKCYNNIKINYAERYLELGKDTRATEWKPDHLRPYCQDIDCSKKFSIMNRKHHCRFCGDVYCDKCTSLRISINEIANLTQREIQYMVDNNENGDDLQRICYQCLRKMLNVDCDECQYSFCLLCNKPWHDKLLCFECDGV